MAGWKQVGCETGSILLKIFWLVVVLGSAWFVYDFAKDCYTDSFIAFDREPEEGWAYWHQKYFWESLRSWSVPILITLGISGTLIWSICRSFVRLIKIP